MYVDIVISNVFNLNKHFFFFLFLNLSTNIFLCLSHELPNNMFLSPVIGNNENCEEVSVVTREVVKQEMRLVLTVNRN